MSDLLEEATRALREQPADEPEDALERILASLEAADVLDDAVRALRFEEEPSDGLETLARIQSTLERDLLDEATAALRHAKHGDTNASADAKDLGRDSSRAAPRHVMRAAAAVALLLAIGAPTAWAWTSGRLDPWLARAGMIDVEALDDVALPAPERDEVEAAPTQPPSPEAPPEALSPEPPLADDIIVAADPTAMPRRSAPPRREVQERAVQEPPRVPDDAETALFAEAHRAHFDDHTPALALAAWDAYLGAHPRGRYELEARYNRALCLARLGRHAAARAELAPFADGAHGSYRRAEARQLVSALDARIDHSEEPAVDAR